MNTMKKNSVFASRYFTWLCLLLVAASVTIILAHSLKKEFDHDEFEAVHTAWKILQGEEIYIDFIQHHHPFYYHLLAPVLVVSGEDIVGIYAMRIVSFVMLILTLVVTWGLSIKIDNDKQKALLSVLLLSTALIFVESAIEIRPDVPQALFGLISILMLFGYLEKKQRLFLILSAISLAASFLFLQKSIFLIGLLGLLLLINAWKQHILLRDVFLYGIVMLMVVGPYFVYLFCSGTLSAYWTFNWLLNMKFLRHFTAFNSLGYAVRTNTLLCVFYIWGLLKFTKTASQIRLGWLSLGLLGTVFLVRAPYEQYFMIVIPLMAIVAANTIMSLFEEKPAWLVVMLVLSVVPGQCFLVNGLKKNNTAQLEKINYVLAVTNPDDYVYDGSPNFNLFRKDLDFFWFSVKPNRALATYQTMAEYDYDIYKLIDKFKPKVISGLCIDNMQMPVIADRYIQSDVHKDLFIRSDGMK